MTDERYELDYADYEQQLLLEEQQALTSEGIERQNSMLLWRYRNFRSVKDLVVKAWRDNLNVEAVSLVGSVARSPWKEVPRFQPYRRERIKLWHESKDLDLTVWLHSTSDLDGLRKAKNRAASSFRDELGGGVAGHQVEVFILDSKTTKFLGRLCEFNQCPKPRKMECLVQGCGSKPFLRKVQGFQWRPETIAEERSVRLFDRSTGFMGQASSLPLPLGDT